MKKGIKVSVGIFLLLFVLFTAVIVYAKEGPNAVSEGQIVDNDFIKADTLIENKGAIKGDLIVFAQTMTSTGIVEGDIIAGANTIAIDGAVGGSVRVGGINVLVSSTVGRNAMVFGSNVNLDESVHIKGNAYLFGEQINAEGVIEGKTRIYGQNITLGGNFGGDVYIHDISENSSLNILPGTNISGKLTYEGKDTYQLPSNVNVSDYEFIKVQPSAAAQPTVGRTVLSYVKKIITLIVYYLFALLIYKLFPRYFEKSGLFIARRPGTATAIGIAAFGSMAGGVIFLFILLLITLFIFKGSVFLFVGLVFFFIIIITVLFAEIPVSLWLGGMVLKDRNSVPGRLALGLVIIWIIKFVLGMLKGLPGAGVAGIILFILNACIWILGTGAILKTVFEIIKGANTHAEVDLDAIEGIDHAGW